MKCQSTATAPVSSCAETSWPESHPVLTWRGWAYRPPPVPFSLSNEWHAQSTADTSTLFRWGGVNASACRFPKPVFRFWFSWRGFFGSTVKTLAEAPKNAPQEAIRALGKEKQTAGDRFLLHSHTSPLRRTLNTSLQSEPLSVPSGQIASKAPSLPFRTSMVSEGRTRVACKSCTSDERLSLSFRLPETIFKSEDMNARSCLANLRNKSASNYVYNRLQLQQIRLLSSGREHTLRKLAVATMRLLWCEDHRHTSKRS